MNASTSAKPRDRVALIGSGPTAIYFLKHLLDEVESLKSHVASITIFEKERTLGLGMPYNPRMNDACNICNITSEELPILNETLANWLRGLDLETLNRFGLSRDQVCQSETYSRVIMGYYFAAQLGAIVSGLERHGLSIVEMPSTTVVDLEDISETQTVVVHGADGDCHEFDRVVIATGHSWTEEDKPKSGYFASPWPISKLRPEQSSFHNFTIGTLGASLSAFDVIVSLAHRHGSFRDAKHSEFNLQEGAEGFKIVMHSAEGWLPHLQYEQVEPFRQIFRHVDRETLMSLRDENGFLRLERFFDKVCRPALTIAFQKDDRSDLENEIREGSWSLSDFIKQLTEEHEYDDPFSGMRSELPEARESVNKGKPIHWKEVLDDLMYTLNYHAELMPAEDHIRFHEEVMPFLMNVIAAMPLQSARTMLALHAAGCLELVSGFVKVVSKTNGRTSVEVDNDGEITKRDYRMFIDCTGQKPIQVENYPFQSLVDSGSVRAARLPFINKGNADSLDHKHSTKIHRDGNQMKYSVGGIAVDRSFRVIGENGESNLRIHDIAFPHATGLRPYSYGLQACNLTAAVVVGDWLDEFTSSIPATFRDDAIAKADDDVIDKFR